jgi:hypothetical protein
MGYGEFGGNGSVHWRVGHEGTRKGDAPREHKRGKGHYYAADPIPNDEVGVGKGAPAGHMRLDVMYDYPADAQAALHSISVQGSSLVLFVKANTATPPKGADVPAQIRISW